MKKKIFLLACLLLGCGVLSAQGVQSYQMWTNTEEYVSIVSTGTRLTSVVGDGGTQNIAMPFEFPFGEATIAQGDPICMRADGYMLLNSGTGTHNAYGYCNTGTRVIVPFLLVDGQMPQGNSGCWWQVDTADDGRQVLVVEFQHVQHYNVSTDNFNYQVRLYENGDVAVHYGHMENHANDSSFNFMMVSDVIAGYNDAIALMGSWDNPTAFHPYTMGSSSSSVPHHITGMPDSGLVVTYYRPEPPCPKPTHVRAEELEATSCQLMWTGNGVGGCTYEVYMDTTPFNVNYPGSRPLLSTNDTVLYLDSLLPNHQYAGYIRSNCGADVSNWASFSIYTPCVSISHAELPFTEDFEFYTGSQYRRTLFNPGCWRGDGYVTQQSGYGGHRCLFLSNGNDAQPIIVALPAIDSVSELELTFSVQQQSGTLEVGVLDAADNLLSFVPVQTISAPANTWTTRSVRFNNYQGTGKAIAFRVTTAVSRIYIDDIEVHVAVGCPAVETVTVGDVTHATATVSWTDPNLVGSYRVVYHPLLSPSATTTVNASASPVSLTGLTPDEDYVVEVYSLCGSQQGAAVADTFSTLCAPVTAPFGESFEGESLSRCWTVRSMRFLSSNPVPAWLPGVSTTMATAGSGSLRLESKRSNLVGREASWVVLPTMTDAPNRVMVDFDYRVPSGYEYVELAVGITSSETDTSGFVRLASIRPSDGNWHRYSFNFALSGITDGRIALLQDNHSDHSYAGGLPNDYGYLDSVVVTPFTGCMRPVALAVSMVSDEEATVSWVDVNGAGTYEVSCGPQTVTVMGDTSWTFTGLSPQTTYAVSVRTVCPDGFTEAISTTFTTTCPGISVLPWSENFDSWPTESFDSCWTRLEGPDHYSCVEVFSMTHSVRMNSDLWQGDTARSFLVLPFVAVPYAGLSLSMNVSGVSTSMSDAMLELGVMTNVTDRSSFTAFDTIPFVNGITNWTYYEHALSGIGDGRLALRLTSFSSWKQVLIDDLSLFYATSCVRPDSLVLDSADLGSLSVRIVDPDTAGQYRLWWSDGSTIDSADVSGYTYTITGLHHSTRYNVSVASICPSDGTLSTVLDVRMATACGVISHNELPWSESYNDGLGLCQSFIDYCYPGNSGDRTNRTIGRGNSGALVPNVGYNYEPFYYVMPQVDSLGGVAVDFWARGEATVQVGVMSDPADTLTFTAIQTITLPSLTDWHEYYVSLGSYSATDIHVAMRFGNGGSRFHASVVVDDVMLVHDLTCQAPDSVSVAAVTDSSALLVVHDPRGVGHYRVYVMGDTIDFHGDSVMVGGLQQVTEYTLAVASVCTEGLATFPVEVTFTTDCGINELPWEEDFETLRTNRIAPCWNYVADSSSRPWVFNNSMSVRSGQQALTGSVAVGDSLVTVVSPLIHIADTDLYVNFLARVYQSVYNDSAMHGTRIPMRVRVSYQDDAMSLPVVIYDDSLQSYETSYSAENQWHLVEIATTQVPVGTGNFYFSFFRDTIASSASFALDSIVVYAIHHAPPCMAVDDVTVSDTTLTSATLVWTPRGVEETWQVHLFNTFTDSLITTGIPTVTITHLRQATDYRVAVGPICDDGTVLWSDTLDFTTLECTKVDDLSVTVLSFHSVRVGWQAHTSGPWNIEYGEPGFSQGMGTRVVVPEYIPHDGVVEYILDSLQEATTYQLYVRTLCDDGLTSVWTDPATFTTALEGIVDHNALSDVSFSVFPNPFTNHVTLTCNVGEPLAVAVLTDLQGRRCEVALRPQGEGRYLLEMDDFPQAVYLLTVVTTSGHTGTLRLLRTELSR
jgi:hypothetical protein